MTTLKRGLDGGMDEMGNKKIKADGEAKGDDLLEIRVLIDNFMASVVIGKGGSNVKQVRTESGAFVSILKHDNPSKERIMTVKGTEENISHAMGLIHSILLAAQTEKGPGGAQTDDAVPSASEEYAMKLMIHKFLAGSIIGKGGCIIKEIQEASKARISLSNEPLPNSTEKTVQITGTAETFRVGLQRVLTQLFQNSLKPGCTTILYVPGAVGGPMGMPMGGPMGGPMGPGPSPYPPYGAPHHPPHPQHPHQHPVQYGGPQNPYAAPGGYQQPPYGGAAPSMGGAPGGSKTEKIVIPTVCTGTVIGKGGQIISDIKTQSGTQITIADASPTTPEDRVVAITGSSQGIQFAISLIRQRVESYQPPNAM